MRVRGNESYRETGIDRLYHGLVVVSGPTLVRRTGETETKACGPGRRCAMSASMCGVRENSRARHLRFPPQEREDVVEWSQHGEGRDVGSRLELRKVIPHVVSITA